MTTVVALGLILAPGPGSETIRAAGPAAQDVPEPPGLGAPFFQSALTGPEVFRPGTCPSDAAGGENVEEGFMLTVRGRCLPEANAANLAVSGRDITVWDGDVAIDFKVAAGAERAGVNVYVRRVQGDNLLGTYISLATGQAELFKREAGVNTTVASRQDLGEYVDPTDWNRLALRLSGDQIWLLINGAPLLHAADAPDYTGAIGIGLVREGNPDDQDEVAVVFRDLTLTALDDTETERSPGHSQP